MDDYNRNMKKSGQMMIPEFGKWDYVNDLPITQYFDSAREAGLFPYTDCHLYSASPVFHKPPLPPKRSEKAGANQTRRHHAKNSSDAVRLRLRLRARKMKEQNADDLYKRKVNIINIVPKPVDEDLYKIPPELLRTSKKKRMLRFFTKCVLPGCAA